MCATDVQAAVTHTVTYWLIQADAEPSIHHLSVQACKQGQHNILDAQMPSCSHNAGCSSSPMLCR